MSAPIRVFISSTSTDLTSYRKLVAEHLHSVDALPVVQDWSGTESGDLLGILQRKIKSCDVVVCLVGVCYGREPHPERQNGERRSYTQREYDMAKALGKPVFVFIAGQSCRFDSPSTEPHELVALQQKYIASFQEAGLLTHKFSTKAELERLLGKLKLPKRRPNWVPALALLVGLGTFGFATWSLSIREKSIGASNAPVTETPQKVTTLPLVVPGATLPREWVNELGMSFMELPGFPGILVAKHETTWKNWMQWGGGDASMVGRATEDCPVVGVRLSQITQFCTWLTDQSLKSTIIPPGSRYRLPTNDEWNALAGLTIANAQNPLYPWGPEKLEFAKLHRATANFAASETSVGNRLLPPDAYSEQSPVGCFQPNKLGLFDVSGNVAELCVTQGHPVYLRGGSWADNDDEAFDLRFARETDESDVEKDRTVGFRVVLERNH